MKENVVAVLTLKNVSKMTRRQRLDISDWLMKQADNLRAEGSKYSDRFRARFITNAKPV